MKLGILIIGGLIALLGGELLARSFDLDLRILRKTLYYQCGLLSLYRTSAEAQRLFELVPGKTVEGLPGAHPKETKYSKVDFSINDLGFRGRSFPAAKKEGVFRIVIFGGSSAFGATVSDEDTYPAQLQKIFDEKCPGKVEVWNAGISAYVMSQNVAYAETVVKKYDPDLLIFQDTNTGRRAFGYTAPLAEIKGLFRKNRELFIENIPPLWNQDVLPTGEPLRLAASVATKIHNFWVVRSAFYRGLCLIFYHQKGAFVDGQPVNPITERYGSAWASKGQEISDRELGLFVERHQNIKIRLLFLSDFPPWVVRSGILTKKNVKTFILPTEGMPPEYREVHPPSYVYAWSAQKLYDLLIQEDLFLLTGIRCRA
ncbi:MAG: hypothetical protein KTQ49_02510 [Candidatus Omnitrophica bacterium]|nr:hypothetical protein [Candidatus Omnitrophota bacterium]